MTMAAGSRRQRVSSAARWFALAAFLALLLLLRPVAASGMYSLAKSQQSNPVVAVVVDGKPLNLILTTDMDGILLCQDRSISQSVSAKRIDYDYARKLVRYQLSGLTQTFVNVALAVPSLDVSTLQVRVGVFYLSQQTLSPAALAFFLHHSNADGFLGIGYAYRLTASPFWNLLDASFQYRVSLENSSSRRDTSDDEGSEGDQASLVVAMLNGSDFVAGQDESEQTELDWSEPWASVDQADDVDLTNNQGLGFPVHHVQFQCAKDTSALEGDAIALQAVELFGDLTSNWDVAVDFNSPCLVLPQQFFNSLAGWTGLTFDEDAKIALLPVDVSLPPLAFALTHGGLIHELNLNALVLNSSNGTKAVCIQRSTSIVHNGASVFSPIDTESTAQRYRLHGTMMLPVYSMQQAPIVFGTMVLRSLGEMVVDGEAKQLAFQHPTVARASKKRGTNSAVPVCVSSPKCIGQQEFSPRLNSCLDPGCQSYFFQSLDPETKVCVIDADWLTFLYTTVAVFMGAELLLTTSISRQVRSAIAEARST